MTELAPKALLFDVQGTATDFHTTVRTAAAEIAGPDHAHVDWSAFVNDWRAAYFRETSAGRPAGTPWISVASIYRATLDEALAAVGVDLLASQRDRLSDAWKHLDPWPDVVPALHRLRRRYLLATLSNADVDAVVSITRHGDLPWHAVFAAEMAGVFKPDPAAYHLANHYLGLPATDIMMVASHKYDLRAARALGFRTAFVLRPLEYGDPALADLTPDPEFDLTVTDFADLADRLGC